MHQNLKHNRIQSVEKDYQKLLNNMEKPIIPNDLAGRVMLRIAKEERRASFFRLALFVPLVLLSSVAVIVSFQYLVQASTQSGLSEYFSILFSDGNAILSFWREFLLSVVERVPVIGMTLFFGAVLILLGSIKSTLKSAQTLFHGTQLAH